MNDVVFLLTTKFWWIELPIIFPSSVRFSASKLHTSALTAILYTFVIQTTPTHQRACNSHGTQPATAHPDWDKDFPTGSGHCAGWEDCSLNPFMHRRTAIAHPEPTKSFPKWSPETAMLSVPFGYTHPPPLSCQGHCRKWYHKMKVSCQIYPATSGKRLIGASHKPAAYKWHEKKGLIMPSGWIRVCWCIHVAAQFGPLSGLQFDYKPVGSFKMGRVWVKS